MFVKLVLNFRSVSVTSYNITLGTYPVESRDC